MKQRYKNIFYLYFFHSFFIHAQPPYIEVNYQNIDVIAEIYGANEKALTLLCYEYFYLVECNVVCKNYKKLIQDLPAKASYAFNEGNLTANEKENYHLQYKETEHQIARYTYLIGIVENEINQLLDTIQSIVPVNDTLEIFTSDYIQYFLKNNDLSMLKDSSTQHKLYIENMLMTYELEVNEFLFFKNNNYKRALQMDKNTEYKLKSEALTYFQYIEALATTFPVKLKLLKLYNQLNQKAIEFHYTLQDLYKLNKNQFK